MIIKREQLENTGVKIQGLSMPYSPDKYGMERPDPVDHSPDSVDHSVDHSEYLSCY